MPNAKFRLIRHLLFFANWFHGPFFPQFPFQMNFPGRSIDELVLEEPDEADEEVNGDAEDEDESENSEDIQGKQ